MDVGRGSPGTVQLSYCKPGRDMLCTEFLRVIIIQTISYAYRSSHPRYDFDHFTH